MRPPSLSRTNSCMASQSPALWDRGTEAADLMSVVLMSKRELNRIDILARLESGRLTPGAAALLQVSERQVYRLRRRFRDGGPAGIADRRRGRPSNNRLPAL